ncbi:hypothetical protein ACN22W_29585 [Burkholderia theae]|uniref:hypothetical protein n=1 Tax=Burkholderia theae TaxID=3143496 RepID=UPI003AFA217A
MTLAGLDSQRIQAGDLFDAVTPHGMRRPFPILRNRRSRFQYVVVEKAAIFPQAKA